MRNPAHKTTRPLRAGNGRVTSEVAPIQHDAPGIGAAGVGGGYASRTTEVRHYAES